MHIHYQYKNLRPRIIGMAETRALARTLRFAGNIHGVMAEELKEVVKVVE